MLAVLNASYTLSYNLCKDVKNKDCKKFFYIG